MPRPRRSPEEIEAMRQRILDVAHDLLHERGPEALSVRSIAERLGCSPMALYSYYSNREAIMEALRERHDARVAARDVEDLRQAEAGDVVAVVQRHLEAIVARAHRDPRSYCFMFVQPLMADRPVPFPGRPGRLRRHLAELIAVGVDQGVFWPRDPDLAATTAVCLVQGPLLLHYGGRLPDAELAARVAEEAIAVAMAYLRGELRPLEPTNKETPGP